MRSKTNRLSGLVAVIGGLVVAAGVVAQVYPVRWEEPIEEAQSLTPPAALTIDSFYVRTRKIECPGGTGVDCDVPGGLLTTKCDAGDAAVGGSAYTFATSYGNQPSRAWGVPQPKGWQGMSVKVQEGNTLFVKAVCARIVP